MTKPPLGEAHKLRQIASKVFQYAIVNDMAEANPAEGLRGALAKKKPVKHYATVTEPRQVGALLRAIDGYTGSFPVLCALRLAPLLFVRPPSKASFR